MTASGGVSWGTACEAASSDDGSMFSSAGLSHGFSLPPGQLPANEPGEDGPMPPCGIRVELHTLARFLASSCRHFRSESVDGRSILTFFLLSFSFPFPALLSSLSLSLPFPLLITLIKYLSNINVIYEISESVF